ANIRRASSRSKTFAASKGTELPSKQIHAFGVSHLMMQTLMELYGTLQLPVPGQQNSFNKEQHVGLLAAPAAAALAALAAPSSNSGKARTKLPQAPLPATASVPTAHFSSAMLAAATCMDTWGNAHL
ncbi:hypothetical protein HaLaN_14634, partial [Haematococcus lacustris]